MNLGRQDSISEQDNATESLIEHPEGHSQFIPERTKKWNRKKGMKVMLISCLVFAIAVTVALVVDIYIGEHYTGHSAISTDVQQCSDVGSSLMKKGGSAVDAAVGALLCVGVMNPESSGIGGGGVMVVSIPKHGEKVIDFRETAPQSSTGDMFDKDPSLANEGGLAVAIPGEIKGLELAHKKYGKLKWSEVVEPAIKLARDGFTISNHTAMVLNYENVQNKLKKYKKLMEMFAPNGEFLKAGAKLKNPKLADTLAKIAKYGSKAIYEGPIAQSIIDSVKERNGNISLDDLRNYKVEEKDCLYSEYQGYQIMLPPLPSAGPFLISALNILERFNFTKTDQDKNTTYQYLLETFKFAFAQQTHLGDPVDPANKGVQDFIKHMMSKKTAATIQYKIYKDKTFPASYYSPASDVKPINGTSHVSVLGPDGEIVSVTSTINGYFGSYVMTDTGIILNNQMDDFSIGSPYYKGNRVWPGKKPLSACSPMIVKHKQDSCLYMALGGSGGTRIPTAVIQILVNILSFNDSLQDAVERPRVHHQLTPNVAELEGGRFSRSRLNSLIDYLQDVGHVVKSKGVAYADVNVAQNYRSNLRAHSDSRRPGSGVAVY